MLELKIKPGSTVARDLPFGMVSDVCDVLDAYGLHVKAGDLNGQGIVEVMMALSRVIDGVPAQHGGRKQ